MILKKGIETAVKTLVEEIKNAPLKFLVNLKSPAASVSAADEEIGGFNC